AEEPRDGPAGPGEVRRRLRLVDGPGPLDTPRGPGRQRERRRFYAVGHLEHHAQGGPEHQRGDDVVEKDDMHGVQQQRDPECPGEEERLPGEQENQISPGGAADSVAADSAGDEPSEIVDELPLDRHQSVERPEVEVLPAVKWEPGLMWRDPAEEAEVEIAVVAGDIDVRVMDDAVLPAPEVRAAPQHVERHRHQLVDRAMVGIRLVSAVVLNVESDAG